MHGEDEETWRRGEERGGEGRKDGEEKRRDGEGKLTGGRPSRLLRIFIPPVEAPNERDG